MYNEIGTTSLSNLKLLNTGTIDMDREADGNPSHILGQEQKCGRVKWVKIDFLLRIILF